MEVGHTADGSFSAVDEAYMLSVLIWWIIVGLIAGWGAGKIMKGRGYGPLMDIVLGMLALISQQKNKKAVVSWHNSYSE